MKTNRRFVIDVELDSEDYEDVKNIHETTYQLIEEILSYILNIYNDKHRPYDEGYIDVKIIDDLVQIGFTDYRNYLIEKILKEGYSFNESDTIETIFKSFKILLQ